jgi:hypothetical protein
MDESLTTHVILTMLVCVLHQDIAQFSCDDMCSSSSGCGEDLTAGLEGGSVSLAATDVQ